MKIATIVSSNSHVDYVARVIGSFDVAEPPKNDEYGFGSFVSIDAGTGEELVGVVYNSLLVNPDYAQFGPRLSGQKELETFSPDFLDEQGCLLAVLILGQVGADSGSQSIPAVVIPPGKSVKTLDQTAIKRFHKNETNDISLHYFSHVIAHAGPFAVPLLEKIISELMKFEGVGEEDINKLLVLKRSLVWQRTVGQMRL